MTTMLKPLADQVIFVPARPVRLSIVIPVFRGEKSIGPLVQALVANLAACHTLEIVLVNDGSPDQSAAVCRTLAERFSFVKFLNLSRNFSEQFFQAVYMESVFEEELQTSDEGVLLFQLAGFIILNIFPLLHDLVDAFRHCRSQSRELLEQ